MNLNQTQKKIIERFGSQKSFAAAIGCTQQTVSRVLNGHQRLGMRAQELWTLLLDLEEERK